MQVILTSFYFFTKLLHNLHLSKLFRLCRPLLFLFICFLLSSLRVVAIACEALQSHCFATAPGSEPLLGSSFMFLVQLCAYRVGFITDVSSLGSLTPTEMRYYTNTKSAENNFSALFDSIISLYLWHRQTKFLDLPIFKNKRGRFFTISIKVYQILVVIQISPPISITTRCCTFQQMITGVNCSE